VVAEVLDNPEVAVGRELTKLHEEVVRGRAREVAAAIAERGPRGEFVVAVHVPAAERENLDAAEAAGEIDRLLDEGMSARDVARRLEPKGISRRVVYAHARARQR
jgi:16S rRNA (cytidine1402-2'-O)-methyltransferase